MRGDVRAHRLGAEGAIQVVSGTTTSSPGLRSRLASARCRAAVQEGRAIAYFRPTYAANAASNRPWYMFALPYQALVTASVTYSISFSVIEGPATGIRSTKVSLSRSAGS